MSVSVELIDDASVADLPPTARAFLWSLRVIATGRGSCNKVLLILTKSLGPGPARCASEGMRKLVPLLPAQSRRGLTLAPLCSVAMSWDEVAILSLIDAAARESESDVSRWLARLSIRSPNEELQDALSCVAGAIADAKSLIGLDIAGVTRKLEAPARPAVQRGEP